jgi:hypothetical protein
MMRSNYIVVFNDGIQTSGVKHYDSKQGAEEFALELANQLVTQGDIAIYQKVGDVVKTPTIVTPDWTR